MSLHRRLYAALYDWLNATAAPQLAPFRQRTAGQAHGQVLEIGAGTGANLPSYGPDVRLTVLEPSAEMAARLQKKAAARGLDLTVVLQRGESLPFPDGSFDAVVATLVLCSVADPARVVAEVKRVLRRPSDGRAGGVFLFFEHVVSEDERIRRWQRRLNPIWGALADGCHLDRDTAATIRAAGFSSVEIERTRLPAGLPLTASVIVGRAAA